MASTSSTITSAPISTTGQSSIAPQTATTSQPVASSQKGAAERTLSMAANVSIYIYFVGELESFAVFFCIL